MGGSTTGGNQPAAAGTGTTNNNALSTLANAVQQAQQVQQTVGTQPQYASQATQYASTGSGVANPAGFIPPQGGYGVPTNTLQTVQQTQPPATLAGQPLPTSGQIQQAGYTPLSAHPNYNLQMGGTTGYKNPTMK